MYALKIIFKLDKVIFIVYEGIKEILKYKMPELLLFQ